MRTKITLVVLFLIEACGTIAVWIFATGRWQINPHGTIAHLAVGMLLSAAIFAAIMVILLTPAFLLGSCLIIKRAIESAFRNDYKQVQSYLTRKWVIFLPLPKYAEIVRILRHLCKDRKTKPEGLSPEFSECIVLDDWGNYVLSWEGKEKMIRIMNSGWISAEKAEKFTSPKTFNILMGIVAIVAVIRGIALIIHLFVHH